MLRSAGAVDVQVVGAGALNQAIKAIAIARGFVAPSNIDLVCIPTFADIQIDGQSRTAIRLAVENRPRRQPATSRRPRPLGDDEPSNAADATQRTLPTQPATADQRSTPPTIQAPRRRPGTTSTSSTTAGAVAEAFATSEPAVVEPRRSGRDAGDRRPRPGARARPHLTAWPGDAAVA